MKLQRARCRSLSFVVVRCRSLLFIVVHCKEAPFPNGQTRRVRIGIAADFRAQAESLHAQFQSALLARD